MYRSGGGSVLISKKIVSMRRHFGGQVVLIGVGKKNLAFNFTMRGQEKRTGYSGARNALKADFTELIDLVKGGAIDLGKDT